MSAAPITHRAWGSTNDITSPLPSTSTSEAPAAIPKDHGVTSHSDSTRAEAVLDAPNTTTDATSSSTRTHAAIRNDVVEESFDDREVDL